MIILLIISALVLIGADQLVKYWAVNSLQPVHTMDFIKFGDFRILDLTYLENDGAIFGSMSGQKWFLVGFTSIIIIAGIVVMFLSAKKSKFLSFCIMLFVAGGIGNLIDRIRLGYVVDMFEVKLFHFAIFNVADICVTCAFVLIFVYVLFIEPKTEKAQKLTEAEKNE
ncbi:MAG: signal peptidase II [Ruminococcus flavefaciens]|nr:signal peptidase II [Ruminococcus flavefaciens]MCM1229501.1 signal peptidase II [Ruminococcus flavefaciens]